MVRLGKPTGGDINGKGRVKGFDSTSGQSIVSNCFATPWTVACQAPLSVGFFRQEYRSGLPFPSPGDLPDPGMELHLLCLLHCRRFFTPATHGN